MNENNDFDRTVDANVPPRTNRPRRVNHYFSPPPAPPVDEQQQPGNGFDENEFEIIDEPPEKKSNAPMIIAVIAAVVVVLGAAGFLSYLFFFSGGRDSDAGKTKPTAAPTEAVTEETVPTSQPLTENGVAKLVTMPDLSGLTEAEAYQKLNAADVKYKVKREYSDDVKLNYVISQSPEAGTEFSRNIDATVYISKGKENEIIPTPTATGTTKPQSSKSDDDDDDDDSSSKASGNSDDYLLPGSDSKYLTKRDLEGLGRRDLNLALNEIYARHGRKFSDPDISAYFNSKSWYHGTVSGSDFDMSVLNSYEYYNLDLILDYQSELGYR